MLEIFCDHYKLVKGSHFKECFLQTKIHWTHPLELNLSPLEVSPNVGISGFFFWWGGVGLIKIHLHENMFPPPGKWTVWTWKDRPNLEKGIWKIDHHLQVFMLIFTWNSKHPFFTLVGWFPISTWGPFPSIIKWVVSGSRQLCARNFPDFSCHLWSGPPSTSSYQWATWKRTDSFCASNQMAITTSTNQLGGGKKWRSYAWQDGFK